MDPDGVHVEYQSRALVKIERAGRLFESLEREIDKWNADHLVFAPMRSPRDGPQRLEIFRPEVLDRMPVAAWEATFHDGVHNLRVALDALCFELCHLHDQKPESPGKIHFPISEHPNEWSTRTQHLGTIPAPLLERMRQVQGWARSRADGEPDPLTLISRVDNHDKHRASGVTLDVFALPQWAIRKTKPIPQELAEASAWPLERWMDLYVTPPVPRGQAALIPVMAWPYVRFQDLFANIADGQRWLYRQTDRIIAFIASGEWQDAGFEHAIAGPAWSAWPPVSHDGVTSSALTE